MIPDYAGEESKDSRRARLKLRRWRWRHVYFWSCLSPYLFLVFVGNGGLASVIVVDPLRFTWLALACGLVGVVAIILAWLEKVPESIGMGCSTGISVMMIDIVAMWLRH